MTIRIVVRLAVPVSVLRGTGGHGAGYEVNIEDGDLRRAGDPRMLAMTSAAW